MDRQKQLNIFFRTMSEQWFEERSETQMTIGKLIAALEEMPAGIQVNLGSPHSYRGYYSDLGITPCNNTAWNLLAELTSIMGRKLQGYKGGDFIMHEKTPVWVASWGSSGRKLMTLSPNGDYTTAPDEF
jgi:hypothetical protein